MHRPFVFRATHRRSGATASQIGSAGLLAFALMVGSTGCGDDATCPTGTAGDPCRYNVGVGDAPSVPRGPDASLGTETDAAPNDPDSNDMGAGEDDVDDDGRDSSSADPPTPNQEASAGTRMWVLAAGKIPRVIAMTKGHHGRASPSNVHERHFAVDVRFDGGCA